MRADGKEAFSHYCIACHGMDGQNTGVPSVGHILPPIRSLRSPGVQSYSDG
ncbi:MAG TPA: c-type cytochrome [Terracidiphilus sp.]